MHFLKLKRLLNEDDLVTEQSDPVSLKLASQSRLDEDCAIVPADVKAQGPGCIQVAC